jgi:hypothetical protein
MKKVFSVCLSLFFLFIIAQIVIAQEKSNILLVLETPKEEVIPLKQYFKTYYSDDDFLIVETHRELISHLDKFDYQVIDQNGWSGEYYILSNRPGKRSINKINIGEIIYSRHDLVVVKTRLEEEKKLFHPDFNLLKITNTEKPLRKIVSTSIKNVAPDPDPIILDIIEKISIDSMKCYLQSLENFKTRYTRSDSIIPAGEWIFKKYKSFGYTDVKFDTFYLDGVAHRNIIATKQGLVFPDSILMIGGHFDSITPDSYSNPNSAAPGAEDNGSGTVSAIESARILAHHQLEATVKFVAWDAEEIGLRGSYAYAEKAYNNNENIGFYLNFDMVGYQHPNDQKRDIRIFTDAASRPFAELMADMARTYTTLIPSIPGNSSGSDHRSFQQWGFRSIFGFEGQYDFSNNPHYHRSTDLVENMDLDFYKENVQMGLATILHLAGTADNFQNLPYVKYKSHQIDDDSEGESIGNGNGFLDAAEKIELSITSKNFGEKTATEVSGILRSSDPFVDIIDSLEYFGTFQPETEKKSEGNFLFQISPEAVSGHSIKFDLVLQDDSSNSWNNQVKLKIEMPEIKFYRHHPIEVSGNGDNKIDQGETFNLLVNLQNNGLRSATGISAILKTEHPSISITDSAANFNDIPKSEIANNAQDNLTFKVHPVAKQEIVPFILDVTEGAGFYKTSISFNIAIGQGEVLLVEDDGPIQLSHYYTQAFDLIGIPYQKWNTEISGAVPSETLLNYERVIWYTSTEFFNSLFEFGTDNLEDYLDNGGRLFINGAVWPLSLITKPLLSEYFFIKYVSHQTNLHHLNSVSTNYVLGDLDFWLEQEGDNSQGLTGEIDPISPSETLLLYDQNTYEGEGTIKSSGAGALSIEKDNFKVVMFAFGWEGIKNIDTRLMVLINILNWLQGDIADIDPDIFQSNIPDQYELFQNYPNPFNPSTKINFALPKSEKVTITIFNSNGQVIKTLVKENLAAGTHSVYWHGKNNSNQKVTSGIYFYRMNSGNYSKTRKLILLY